MKLEHDLTDLKWVSWGLDHLGKKFLVEGSPLIYRALGTDSAMLFEKISAKESVRRCISEGNLVPEIRDPSLKLSGFECVLSQELLPTLVEGHQIPYERRLLMARKWIDINFLLLQDGLALGDAHLANWAFDSGFDPKWIDFGSIVEVASGAEGLAEFRSENLRPLRLASKFPFLSHWFLDKSISRQDQIAFRAGWLLAIVRKFAFLRKVLLEEDLIIRFRWKVSSRRDSLGSVRMRGRRLRRLHRQVNSLSRDFRQTGFWSDYRSPVGASILPSDARESIICKLVEENSPQSLLDIGGNDGWATLSNAAPGRHLTLLEPDHHAISKFTDVLSRTNLPTGCQVRAVVGGFGAKTGSYDVVLALALTHHLSLGQSWPFDVIADVISSQTRQLALVEFMPWGLVSGEANEPQSTLPSWYSLENFRSSLEKFFAHVEEIDYGQLGQRAPRILLLCEQSSSAL